MSTTKPSPRAPTLADLDALPPGIVGEIIDGVLYTMTKPRVRHQRTTRTIGGRIGDPFDHGRGGPGGWWIVVEPGIELPNDTTGPGFRLRPTAYGRRSTACAAASLNHRPVSLAGARGQHEFGCGHRPRWVLSGSDGWVAEFGCAIGTGSSGPVGSA